MQQASTIAPVLSRIKKQVHKTKSIEAGQVALIGLEEIKAAAGGRWPEISTRIRNTAQHFIESRFSDADVVIPAGDGFLILLEDPTNSGDRFRALQVALNAFFIGDSQRPIVRAEVSSRIVNVENIGGCRQLASDPSVIDAKAIPRLVTFPVWSAAQGVITGYWIAPQQLEIPNADLSYSPGWLLDGHHEEDSYLGIDLAILDLAMHGVEYCIHENLPCLVGFTVHSTTMRDREKRRIFLEAIALIPESHRFYMIGRVAEIEPGTPISIIAEWTSQLRAYTKRVTIELHWTEKAVSEICGVGISSVALVGNRALAEEARICDTAAVIRRWNRDLKNRGYRLRVDNISDPRLLALVIRERVDFCSSRRLWPPVEKPNGMKPLASQEVLKQLRTSMLGNR